MQVDQLFNPEFAFCLQRQFRWHHTTAQIPYTVRIKPFTRILRIYEMASSEDKYYAEHDTNSHCVTDMGDSASAFAPTG